ncbi:MAG TPA: hypothetical protein VMS76_17130 [Planctomycetota bacterium]|nr:hypothetical protein [Planctomycetota bacterium]
MNPRGCRVAVFAGWMLGAFALVQDRVPVDTLADADALTVCVVDAGTGSAVAGARITCLPDSALVRDGRRLVAVGDLAGLDDARRRDGLVQSSDSSGRARFARPAGLLHLSAELPGRWAALRLQAEDRGPVTLRLERDATLRVAVVDASGAALSGVPVAVVARSGLGQGGAPFESTIALASTNGGNGIAHFPHAQTYLGSEREGERVARLAYPLAEDVAVSIQRASLDSPLRLVSPPTGTVSIGCPQARGGTARIRRAPAAEQRIPWFSFEPWRVPVFEGRADFPYVGLGVELEYELTWPEAAMPVKGRAPGPSNPGEAVHIPCAHEHASVVLIGRVVDDELRPVAGALLEGSITLESEGGSMSRGRTIETDAGGGFRLPLDLEPPDKGGQWKLEIRRDHAEAEIDISGALESGVYDCGTLVLLSPGSAKLLERMSDDEIESHYRGARRSASHTTRQSLEACLGVMARRGGERWITFLLEALEASRRVPEEEAPWEAPEDLEILAVLRRAQGRPDPLALRLLDGRAFECAFPQSIVVRVRIENADEEAFRATRGGSYRSGRFARVRVEATGPKGEILPQAPSPGFMGGGLSTRMPLAPGEGWEEHVALDHYVRFPRCGRYRVRILYHDQVDIADEPDILGRIVFASEPFEVLVRPLSVAASKQELAEMRGWVDAIELGRSIPLVSAHWEPGMEFEGEPAAPEDRLFRAGWRAVPVLLGELEERRHTAERRAWILGMLWNLTGVLNPTGGGFTGALGDCHWIESWPGAPEEASPTLAEFGTRSGDIWPGSQAKLIERWLELAELVELEVTD